MTKKRLLLYALAWTVVTLLMPSMPFGLQANVLSAQVQPPFTTLSQTIPNERIATIRVTSATGFSASTQQLDFGIYVDHEFMRVTAINGTQITVQRNQAGTKATPHRNGATVFYGLYGSSLSPGYAGGPFTQAEFFGNCTPSMYPFLPVIEINPQTQFGQGMYNCMGNQWYFQLLPDDTQADGLIGGCNIGIGGVAYASVGTNTTDVANQRMTTSFYVPRTGIYTGIQILQGGTATTDSITAQIADQGGNILATSAAAGVALSGANTFLSIPFALNGFGAAQTKTILTGPALYFVSIVGNGTAAGAYQTVPASTFKNILSQSTGSITFGTFPAFTPPTTFTTNLAPVACLYY